MKKDELHARVLYLYQILRHYSDSEHPLTTQQILKIMDEKYHIQIHRVSVQNYVEILNSCGIKVNQQRAQDKYYYLDDRTFDIPELKLMIDAVQASCFIPEDKTNELIDKLLTLTSDYNADRLRKIFILPIRSKYRTQVIMLSSNPSVKLFMLERKYRFSTLSTMLIKTECCDTMESRISLARTR